MPHLLHYSLFVVAALGTPIVSILSTKGEWYEALLFPTLLFALCYAAILIWGLPLWRRCYLQQHISAMILLPILAAYVVLFAARSGFLFFLLYQMRGVLS